MFRRIADTLSLTTAERRVLQFLVAGFIIGLGIKLVRDQVASPTKFDYSASDSAFVALSGTEANDSTSAEPAPDPSGPVHVNRASKAELMSLPGIGEVMAERIILELQENGPFTSANDLGRVRGIGPKRIEQLRPS
jgi:competence ComEA-like helix-hairpin-helix protein